MSQDYQELIEYLDEKFTKVEGDIQTLKSNFNDLQTSVDAYAHKADTYFQEMIMLTHKVDKHEKILEKLTKKH